MSSKGKGILALSAVLLLLSIAILLLLIQTGKQETGGKQLNTDPDLIEGKRLAEVHCSRCHKYPRPELLPWRTWRFETLGAMAPFLGVEDPATSGSSYDQRKNPSLPKNVYPSAPQVTRAQWHREPVNFPGRLQAK